MSTIKNLIIAIILGLTGYEITKLFLDDGLELPATTPEISLLLIFVAIAFIARLIPSTSRGNATSSSDRELGTVKWFNVRKGYGFITRDLGDDIFVHFRNIDGSGRKAINEGERVSFVVITSEKGPQADEVKLA
ncbi:MAG: cold shock domain-containing protein [Gammaproteobacteria bacterium]|jgi:cold shock protein|nr:cold shock domain-containing protein [Gammaproteobacteria bacterium]MBT4493611.1 cold shock domain-containing protein [Gammaproteobacteria bacterium]MBT7369840.1 cold shock domain-containing protein [Gammaproteobacteria bacterium]